MSTTPEPVEPRTAADVDAQTSQPTEPTEPTADAQPEAQGEQPVDAQPAETRAEQGDADAPSLHAPQSAATELPAEAPDTDEPDAAQPDASESEGGAEPGDAEPEGAEPEGAEPEDAEPDGSATHEASPEALPAPDAAVSGSPPASAPPTSAEAPPAQREDPAVAEVSTAGAPEEAAAPAAPEEAAPATAADPQAADPQAADSASAETLADGAPEDDASEDSPAEGGKRRKKRKKGKGGGEPAAEEAAPAEQPKRKGPEPAEVTARIGTTNDQALAYLANPDPKLSRLSRKVTEALLPDLHPVTAGALLGPAGFTRHLVASAAAGRYRDLFVLWETFRRFPAEAKPELAERSIALAKGQEKLKTAVRIGLTGRSPRLAEDISRAEGLIWTWLREALLAHLPAVGARPAVASALLRREPDLDVPLPAHPDARWLAEAATARQAGPLADPVEAVLGANVHRLPATVDTLRLATVHYPERVAALVDRVDLDAPDIGAFLAWARDHGAADRLHGRIRERVAGAAARDRADGLARWYAWRQRGVQLELPESLRTDSLEGFDLARPETAELAARLVARGVSIDLQALLEELAGNNRQLAEKAYEAMVCAGLDVFLPASLKDNPVVNPGTRCPKCQAWTWVRPGHESRCPRPEAPAPAPEPDPFEFVAAETGSSDQA